jgi:long-subunit fatty acid transport protein
MGSKRSVALCLGGLVVATVSPETAAHAGGLYLPGIGAVSTGRAGASTASVDNPEALLLNPAKLTELHGTQIMIGASLIDLHLSFDRVGSYDAVAGKDLAWEGQDYPTVSDSSSPPVGIGPFQVIPIGAVTSDLGGRVPGLTIAGGLYVPQSYPIRNVGGRYRIDDPVVPPPPSRYDIVEQGAEFFVTTIGAGYRVLPSLDIGGRLAVGAGHLTARTFLWGLPNFDEYTGNEADFRLDVRDNFIPSWGLGATFRPTPEIEVAAQYTGELAFVGEGTAKVSLSQYLSLAGIPAEITAAPDDEARCAKGGTNELLKACADLTLPMSASLAGRYKFLDANGRERGDIELDLGWENWGAQRASSFLVVVDAKLNNIVNLKDGLIRHGFRDTWAARLGGSYRLAVAAQQVTLRGGVAYDTAAAKDGWERLDFDGASRTTLALGASLHTSRVDIDLGGGAILEGTRTVGEACNPTLLNRGCDGTGTETPVEDRSGADPVNPVFDPNSQTENPINHGRFSSHYVLLMLGATTHF